MKGNQGRRGKWDTRAEKKGGNAERGLLLHPQRQETGKIKKRAFEAVGGGARGFEEGGEGFGVEGMTKKGKKGGGLFFLTRSRKRGS